MAIPRMVLAMVVAGCFVLISSPREMAWAQGNPGADPQAAKIAALELRVKELEELVRRVEGRVAAQPAPPLPAPSTGAVSTQAVSFQEGTNPVPEDMHRLAEDAIAAGKHTGSSGWDDGFFIQSADKQHTLRITGQIQTDYRQFLNEHDTTDVSTFLLRGLVLVSKRPSSTISSSASCRTLVRERRAFKIPTSTFITSTAFSSRLVNSRSP